MNENEKFCLNDLHCVSSNVFGAINMVHVFTWSFVVRSMRECLDVWSVGLDFLSVVWVTKIRGRVVGQVRVVGLQPGTSDASARAIGMSISLSTHYILYERHYDVELDVGIGTIRIPVSLESQF